MHGRAIHREHPQPTPLLTQPEAVNLLLQEAIETFKYLGVELLRALQKACAVTICVSVDA